jgi:hypothetical protein
MRKLVVAALAVLLALLAWTGIATGSGGNDVLKWKVMAPVDGPFVGPTTPVRGLAGGGLPWEVGKAQGKLSSDGGLEVRVEGLVLARKAPVPANLQGTNPVPQFRAIVSCLTPAQPVNGENVATDPFPASPQGDARFKGKVQLPASCVAPIVFVTSPANQWFAATGR